jgi:hypothetical protein
MPRSASILNVSGSRASRSRARASQDTHLGDIFHLLNKCYKKTIAASYADKCQEGYRVHRLDQSTLSSRREVDIGLCACGGADIGGRSRHLLGAASRRGEQAGRESDTVMCGIFQRGRAAPETVVMSQTGRAGQESGGTRVSRGDHGGDAAARQAVPQQRVRLRAAARPAHLTK